MSIIYFLWLEQHNQLDTLVELKIEIVTKPKNEETISTVSAN